MISLPVVQSNPKPARCSNCGDGSGWHLWLAKQYKTDLPVWVWVACADCNDDAKKPKPKPCPRCHETYQFCHCGN